jgi:predicted phosphodiesterase
MVPTDEHAPDPAPRLWQRFPRTTLAVEIVLIGVVGAWLGLVVGGRMQTSIGPLETRLTVDLAPTGDSVLSIPPLGELSLDTHDGPVRLRAEVTQIDETAARRLFNDPTGLSKLPDQVSADLRAGLRDLVLRAAGSAVLGALLLGVTFFRHRYRRILLSGAVAAAVVLAGVSTAAATWNPQAINEPTYDGLLASAPSVVGDARDIVNDFQKYEQQLAKIVTNVSRLYDVTSALPAYTPSASTIRVLSVSDLHLNPAAWGVIRSVTKQFDIDLIIDTGDISDHGAAAENAYLEPIASLGVPYVFVRGNHDSEATQQAVAAQANAIVLDDEVREVAGLRLAGIGDPRFTPDKNTRDSPAPATVKQTGLALADLIRSQPPDTPVDIAVIHDPDGATQMDGTVPMTLSGHLHVRKERKLPRGTLQFIQGSTGGSGLRGLEKEKPTPLRASVLYFDRATHALQAWDDITLGGLGLQSASVERHLRDADTAYAPGPSPTPSASSSPFPSATPSPAGSSVPAG